MRVPGGATGLTHGQAAVHGTRMQLYRLGQTYSEPDRQHAGETAGDPVAAHASNIRCDRSYDRRDGAALTIRPRAAMIESWVSGTH